MTFFDTDSHNETVFYLPLPNTEAKIVDPEMKELWDLLGISEDEADTPQPFNIPKDSNAPIYKEESKTEIEIKKEVSSIKLQEKQVEIKVSSNNETESACNILMDLSGKESYQGTKRKFEDTGKETSSRKAPFASKTCNLCKGVFSVPSRLQKCPAECSGILELKEKEVKVLKRAAPPCKKWCTTCEKQVDCGVASKTCSICNIPKSLVMIAAAK